MVSGRYHVVIYSALAGVPVVATPSNTWKVDGVLEMLDIPHHLARTSVDLEALLSAGTPAPCDARVVNRWRVRAERNVSALAMAVAS